MSESLYVPPKERWRCPDCGGYPKKIAWEKRQGDPIAHRQYDCATCSVIWHMAVDESDGYRVVDLHKMDSSGNAETTHFWDGYVRR